MQQRTRRILVGYEATGVGRVIERNVTNRGHGLGKLEWTWESDRSILVQLRFDAMLFCYVQKDTVH